MQKKLTIARAGWGTGGHVFPIKSLIQYLETQSHLKAQTKHQYWFGTKNGLEQEISFDLQKKIKNLTFLPIFSGKRRREKTFSAVLKNLKDLFLFSIGFFQSAFFLFKNQIDVVFCKGGYVALPVVLAATLLWKKIIVHESDVHPWLVNRIASRFSRQNFTGFPGVLPDSKVVGQLLSEELLPDESSLWVKQGSPVIKNIKNQTQILVMWGSQGSRNLYSTLAFLLQTVPELQALHFTVILGKLNQELAQVFSPFPNVKTLGFISQKEIGELYFCSDVAITRAGTTSLAEQELFDMKLLMIPIPWTHDQLDNAKRYVNHKNWILIQEDDPDFVVQLSGELKNLIDFKKTLSPSRERTSEIAQAKDQILESLRAI